MLCAPESMKEMTTDVIQYNRNLQSGPYDIKIVIVITNNAKLKKHY